MEEAQGKDDHLELCLLWTCLPYRFVKRGKRSQHIGPQPTWRLVRKLDRVLQNLDRDNVLRQRREEDSEVGMRTLNERLELLLKLRQPTCNQFDILQLRKGVEFGGRGLEC